MLWGEERRARTSARKKKNINCHATKKRKISDQTTSENVAIVNAADEAFDVHRRFILKIALKINDRKSENFTAADEAGETNEKKTNKTTAIDEAIKEKEVNKATVDEKNVAIAKSKYLTKIFSTTLVIIIFNSWNWLFENFNAEVMMLRLLLTRNKASLKMLRKLWRCEMWPNFSEK